MANLRDVVAYICEKYPHKSELSKARLTKLVYLADWKMSIDSSRQITPTQWYFNHYGPYVADIEQLARSDDAFAIDRTMNYYGGLKEVIRLVGPIRPELSEQEIKAIDFAIEKTKDLSWDSFIKLIYSTYPIVTESRFDYLDLPSLADEYRRSTSLSA
jgi:hypothetical protein